MMSFDETHINDPDTQDPWQAAINYGIDVSRIEYMLTLTPIERLRRHDRALVLVRAVRQAGIAYYGFDPRLPETPGQKQS